MRAVFALETWATRLLPHLCFVAATLLWTRLLALRFGRRPALVLLGVRLIAMTPSGWFYSAPARGAITACMERQIRTLPEGLGDHRVVYLPFEGWEPALPPGEEVWIIHSRLIPGNCEKLRQELRGITHGFGRKGRRGRETAVVYHARVRTAEELRRGHVELPRAFEGETDAQ